MPEDRQPLGAGFAGRLVDAVKLQELAVVGADLVFDMPGVKIGGEAEGAVGLAVEGDVIRTFELNDVVAVGGALVIAPGVGVLEQGQVQLRAGQAQGIGARIRAEVGLPVSGGLGNSSRRAKLATDAAKPGFFEVPPGQEKEFLKGRPLRELSGIGERRERALSGLGAKTFGEAMRSQLENVRHKASPGPRQRLLLQALLLPVKALQPVRPATGPTDMTCLDRSSGAARRMGPSRIHLLCSILVSDSVDGGGICG